MSGAEHGHVERDQRRKAQAQDVQRQIAERMGGSAGMAAYILRLQRTIGNQATGLLLRQYRSDQHGRDGQGSSRALGGAQDTECDRLGDAPVDPRDSTAVVVQRAGGTANAILDAPVPSPGRLPGRAHSPTVEALVDPLDTAGNRLRLPGRPPTWENPRERLTLRLRLLPLHTLQAILSRAQLPGLRGAIQAELEERSKYGVKPAHPKDKEYVPTAQVQHEPAPEKALTLDPASAEIWALGDPDNQFSGLVHIPTGIVYLVPLKPGEQGSTPYPFTGVRHGGRRALPVEHTPIGARQGNAPGAGKLPPNPAIQGASRKPTGDASHTQLSVLVGVPQDECIGFAVSKGQGGVKAFTWTSRSSNQGKFAGDGKYQKDAPKFQKKVAETDVSLTTRLAARRGEFPDTAGLVTETWARMIMDLLLGAFGASKERQQGGQ